MLLSPNGKIAVYDPNVTVPMRALKIMGAVVCFLLAIGELLPIYLIASGLLHGQGGDDTGYFAGRLVLHIFLASLLAVLGWWLLKRSKSAAV